MNLIFSALKKNKRALLYSGVLVLGLLFAVEIMKDHGPRAFLIVTVILSLILLFEVYINWRFATKVLRQIDIPNINAYSLRGHLVNHLLLPIFLFYSTAGFIYFNDDDLIRILTIVIFAVVNLILLINIRAYYRDEFKVDIQTRYVYDMIKLIIFFFCVNLILYGGSLLNIGILIEGVTVFIVALFLELVVMYRKEEVNLIGRVYILVATFLVMAGFVALKVSGILALGVNVLTFLLFYFLVSILHHKLERTLSFELFMEYALIFVLGVVLFLGVS